MYTSPYMATDVVQFREDEAIVDFLRGKGINPNEFGRQAFEAAVRRMRAEEKMKALSKIQAKLDKSPEEIIREERDSH